MLGDNPLELFLNDIYIDPGATAIDNVDGDITGDIVFGGTFLNTSTVGIFTRTYNVSDAANNSAIEVFRTIEIKETNNDPISSFTVSSTTGTTDTIFEFDGRNSSDPDDDTLTYNWSFNTINSAQTTNSYSTAEEFQVSLTVTDGNGGSNTSSKTITVTCGQILTCTSGMVWCNLFCSCAPESAIIPAGCNE